MLLGNCDGGMFPGLPRRQKAIVQPRSDGRGPGASRSLPEPAATAGPGGGTAAVRAPQAPTRGPRDFPKPMGCYSTECPRARAAPHPIPIPAAPSKRRPRRPRGQEWR